VPVPVPDLPPLNFQIRARIRTMNLALEEDWFFMVTKSVAGRLCLRRQMSALLLKASWIAIGTF